MLSYCLKFRKKTESKKPKVAKSKNRGIMLLCAMCNVQCVIVKNRNLSKNKKLADY